MERAEGRCLCGSVRYTVHSKPLVIRSCWCKVCQTIASGNATINLAFPTNAVIIKGKLKDYVSIADSGNRMHRRFCPDCGTHLFSEAEERPNMIVVRAGTLDHSEQVRVEGIIWTGEAPAWADLDPSVPHFEGQPPAPLITDHN